MLSTAVVMFPAQTWYAGAQSVRPFPTPAGVLDPPRWSEIVRVYGERWNGRNGVVMVAAGGGLTARERSRVTHEFLRGLGTVGWKSHPIGADTGWFTCHDEQATIMFGVLPWVDQTRTTLFGLDMPANVIASRLAEYEMLTGGVWRGTGGLSGTGLLRAMYDVKHQPKWRWDKAPGEVHGRSFELLGAHNKRASTADDGPFVHVYDTRAMYLAGASCAELAWDAPEQRGPQEFDPARPGYWRVSLSGLKALAGPDRESWLRLLVRAQVGGELVWVTTPVMQYLVEQLGPIEIHDSITADRRSRVMRGWAERLRDARAAAGDDLRPAIKDTYARTVGMLRRTGGRIHRPDWRDTIVDTSKVNLIRKVDKAGVSPLRWNVDAVWITTHSAQAENFFGDTGAIGGLHPIGSHTLDEYRAKYETTEAVTR